MSEINFDPIKLTQSLVKCASVTPKDDGALLVVQDHLSSMGFDCSPLLFSGNGSYEVKNLFATIGSDGPHLAFAGHTDVVPPGNESSWKHPPFSAIIEGDKLNEFEKKQKDFWATWFIFGSGVIFTRWDQIFD